MHTVTSKLILTPLADAVFQLILIISDSDINETAIPDLSTLATVVNSQIENLITIGTKIQNQQNADEKLKLEMPKACTLVSKASHRLVSGTKQLKDDPMSPAGKAELLESAKGILAGTSNVLYAFDNFEIRKIINCARLCALKSYIIKMESAAFQPQQTVQCLMQISQIVVQLAQVTNKRISELLSRVLKQRLKTAVDEITRESPLLITSSKALLQAPTNPYLKLSRNLSCDRLMDICMEIEIVVQIIIDDDNQGAFGTIVQVDEEFQNLMSQIRATGRQIITCHEYGDEDGMKLAYEKYFAMNAELRKKTEDFIAKVKNVKTKKSMQDLLDKQKAELDNTASLFQNLQSDPWIKNELEHSIKSSDKIWAQITDKKSEYENSFASVLHASDEHGRKMVRSLVGQDIPAAKQAQEAYSASTHNLKQRSLGFMETNKDPKVRKAIQQLIASLEEDENKIQQVSTELISEPLEKGKIAVLAASLAASSKNWGSVDAANSQGDALFGYLRDELSTLGDKLSTAINDKNVEEATSIYAVFVPCAQRLTEQTEEIQEETIDPEKQEKIKAILAEQKIKGDTIITQVTALLANPSDSVAINELDKTLEKYDANWGKINVISKREGDEIYATLSMASTVSGQRIIQALRKKDSSSALVAYGLHKDQSRLIRKRAVEYKEKVRQRNPLVLSKLRNLIARFDQGQEEITNLAPKLIESPFDSAGIENLEALLDENDLVIAQIADSNETSNRTISSLKNEISAAGEKFVVAVKDENCFSASDFLDSYKQDARQFKQNAQTLASNISDPAVKAALFESLTNLEELEDRLFDFIEGQKILTEVTSEAEKIPQIVAILSAADMSRDKIDSEINCALVSEVSHTLNQLVDHRRPETTIGAVFAASAKGDQKVLPGTIKDFKARTGTLSDLLSTLERMMTETDETQLSSKTALLVQRLKKLEPSAIAAYEAVAHTPTDAGALEFSKGMTASWEENIREISSLILGQEGVFMSTEIAEGLKTEYERHVARLEKAIADKKIEDALLESKNVVASSKALLEFAEKEIENTGDETYKAEMQKVILEIKEHIPQFVKRISNLATQWNATQSWPEDESFSLDASIADITRAIAAFNNVVRNQHGVKDHIIPVVEAYEEPIAPVSESWKEEVQEVVAPVVQEPVALQVLIQEEETDDVVYIDEDAPALLSEAEALDTPLRAVAQELRVEAAKWDNQNPIISSVENIGSCFERLSLFHNELKLRPTPEAKKGFIMAARDIVTHSNELVTPAKVVADGCTDNRMVRNLTGTLDRLSTLAQQLKIVAAVKASSPGDRDQDAQLIHCGQNLMQAIKGCMRECDAVSIKQHSVAIKFVKINPDMAAPLVPQGFKKTKRVYRPVSMLPTGRSPSVRKSLLGALAK